MPLFLIGVFVTLVVAQQNSKDPLTDFCRRHQHQTCVIDSKLYIDGGLVYYGTSVTPDSQPERNTWLLWGDLADLSAGTPPLYKNLTKGPEVPTVRGGVLWPDQVNKLFYLFGGIYANGKTQDFNNLWSYDTIYNNWTKITPDGTQLAISWPYLGASDVTEEGVAYYYGGYLGNQSVAGWTGDTVMLNSMTEYDTKKNTWINPSQRGMLVYFGGLEQNTAGSASYASMTDIHIFDIANSRWFTETATGEVPQPRRGFCSGVAWADDRSSYNFYIYGGMSPNETALGDLYILSLPSFKWISWYPDPQLAYFPGGKAWSSCSVIGNAEMLIMGGQLVNPERQGCDAATAYGQHGLLLGQESVEQGAMWHGLQLDIPKYRVPGNITAVIGGGAEGKASATAPAAGWRTSDLGVYFATSYAAASRTATRPLPSASSPVSNELEKTSSNTNSGAIAGGVVGAIVGLAAIVALVWFCFRRRHHQKQVPRELSAQGLSDAAQQRHQHEKYAATPTTTSYPSTYHSPHSHTPGYSPQASPAPPSWSEHSPPMPQHGWSNWDQQRGNDLGIQYANQPYYPPPQDSSQPPSKHAHTGSAELPSNEVLELPEIRSPVPKRAI
ncbi:hypothetical protein E8E12_003136 [Didymella heteroderae]|uniref:Uncharacterized protein n=1 Tax=Didymella heteroderae TaxID=1769908 RepID=A0A9P4WM03_9PLEO|nr:hypothetical protein E8E12_003136 [Didymella heteroderae]